MAMHDGLPMLPPMKSMSEWLGDSAATVEETVQKMIVFEIQTKEVIDFLITAINKGLTEEFYL